MAEPITTTTVTVTMSIGLTALLAGWIGQLEAEVMMVVLSAICGSMMALSAKKKTFWESLRFMFLGVFVSTILAWSISFGIVNNYLNLASPFLPTIVALLFGFAVDKFPILLNKITEKVIGKS